MNKKNSELTVKIIAILGYIGAGLAILGGLMVLLFGRGLGIMYPAGMALIGTKAVLYAILMVAAGIVGIFVSKALWNHKNWARIVILIFCALGVLSALASMIRFFPRGIINLLIHGAIVYFLAFEKSITHLFK
jgi:predicted membrane channel-forming protein YqfA (hemolysin III family)